ncbi:hypothetical protein [Azotobacter beijerinckii]|uniref:Uncharacterized protein n=1 Tax=Azotobacter beijerinckii TaxID=170623 RepID=A0A1I4I5K8_9GAMM|nr:hypothetical protein [Azotobacter beijerinckii]SFL49575.1 hypothetical protein SAMN04244574_04487 [Azotobacter beijerinckii]
MNNPKYSDEYWKPIFRVGSMIDMRAVNVALAQAITREAKPIDVATLNTLWLRQIEPEDCKYLGEHNGRPLVMPQLVYLRYADYSSAIGVELGLSAEDADADEWVSEDMRETRAIVRTLRMIVVEYLGEAEQQMKEARGYGPGEALIQSINTGESLEQSAARLGYAAQGLRVVGSNPKGKG